ncbi:MAG TPA: NAD(P)/FAD-dependent oxidoreductase [Bacteroidales bacterium]|nr:NAD(P)/FAD-dependent oxidoreductase [Bacteroidales bacterium]
MNKYDIIIIGAGLGGLTAGAKLAREGKKVLIIEQHCKPGGCATTFKRGDFTLEVGLHEMDGPSTRDMKTRIFNELEVFENVRFIKVPEFYHFVNDHVQITIPHNPEEAMIKLKETFPEEKKGIEAYFSQILNPGKKAAENEKEKNLGEYLDSIIHNEDLKLVLLGNLGYFHDDPYSISLTYYSVAQGSYYNGGASFIRGGSQILSDHLAAYIQKHGGNVLLNHLVTGLIIEKNKLAGVTYNKTRGKSSKVITTYADEIIANTAMPNVAALLPGEYSVNLINAIKDQKPGASLLTIYFGFKNSLKNIGNRQYSTFVFDSSIKSQSDILKNNKGDFHNRSFTFIDYGQIDSGLAPAGKSVGALCCIDYLSDWENLSSEKYKAKKEDVAQVFITRLEKLIPGIRAEIEYFEVGTSATIKRYTLNPGGAVYGFAQIPSKPSFNISSVPDNLHFASAWGKTGGGFSGAIYSGYLCAYNILRKR